jgi:hypothetical protein
MSPFCRYRHARPSPIPIRCNLKINAELCPCGLACRCWDKYNEGVAQPERVRVFEKRRSGLSVYNGLCKLIDCWIDCPWGGER